MHRVTVSHCEPGTMLHCLMCLPTSTLSGEEAGSAQPMSLNSGTSLCKEVHSAHPWLGKLHPLPQD